MTRHVLHVVPTLDRAAGGTTVVVERLVSAASQNGYTASLATSIGLTRGDSRAASADAEADPEDSSPILLSRDGRARLTRAIQDADILHLHTMWSPLVAFAARQAATLGVPYVLSPHGMLDPWSLTQKALKKRLYLAVVERRTILNAARLLFTAEDERDLAKPIVGRVQSSVIPLGADRPPASVPELREEFLAEHPDLREKHIAIFLGRLHAKKRPADAIRAMVPVAAACPGACLLVAGSGEEEHALRAMVKALNLVNSVRFLGFLKGREKWRAIAAADVFVLPSQQENFAIAMAEALHAGVPALLTRHVNTWREIAGAGAGHVLDETNLVDSIAVGMLAFFNSPSQRSEVSTAALQLATTSFNWGTSTRRTHALYDEVLNATNLG